MSTDANTSRNADIRNGGGFWKGIVVGIAAVLLVVALIAATGFLVMLRCPMCGQMMQDGMMENGMMEDGMMNGDMMGR